MVKDSKIKVLLADDSGFMRMMITDIVNSEDDIQIIDTAVNGKEAVEKTMELNPDVLLLDLTMEDYDGLYAIQKIMLAKPLPIVILSSIRSSNPGAALDALNAGAYDFIDKPSGMISSKIREINKVICNKIREASKIDIHSFVSSNKRNHNEHTFEEVRYDVIAIGASTGGTGSIEFILLNLPSNLPVPVIIAQHMPAEFISSFAKRLDELIQTKVKVAQDNEYVLPNVIYILPGTTNMIVKKNANDRFPRFSAITKTYTEFNFPSVDGLMESVAEVYGKKGLGVILTGMGKDGTEGMVKLNKNGGYTIAQDQESSVVWGMPRSAWEAGSVKQLVNLKEMPGFIVSCIS